MEFMEKLLAGFARFMLVLVAFAVARAFERLIKIKAFIEQNTRYIQQNRRCYA